MAVLPRREPLRAAGDVAEDTQFGRGIRAGATGAKGMARGVEAAPNQMIEGWLRDALDVPGQATTPDPELAARTGSNPSPGRVDCVGLVAVSRSSSSRAFRSASSILPSDLMGRMFEALRVASADEIVLCMTEPVHASAKGSEDNHFQGTAGRTSEGLRAD